MDTLRQVNKSLEIRKLVATSQDRKLMSQQQFSKPIASSLENHKKEGERSPGPNAYKIKSIFDNKHGFTIPSSSKFNIKIEKRPDPWSYLPKDSAIKMKSPNATIGKEKKLQIEKEGPSPAQYKTNYNFLYHSAKKPVFGKQQRTTPTQITPSPFDYDTFKADSIQHNHRAITIGTQRRSQNFKSDIPSPNKYQPQSDIDIGIKQRKGFSMAQRLKMKTESDSPLDYFRQQPILQYSNVNKQILMPKAPAFTIKKSHKRDGQEVISPGPAAYMPPNTEEKGIVIGRQKRKLHDIVINPGPQAYTILKQTESPSYSIPKAQNIDRINVITPGPAVYNPESPRTQKYKSVGIGYGDRVSVVSNQKNPGPGHYKISANAKNGYTIGKESKGHQIEGKGPGPSEYFIDFAALKKHIFKK